MYAACTPHAMMVSLAVRAFTVTPAPRLRAAMAGITRRATGRYIELYVAYNCTAQVGTGCIISINVGLQNVSGDEE